MHLFSSVLKSIEMTTYIEQQNKSKPTILLRGIRLTKMHTYIHSKFIPALFIIFQTWMLSECPAEIQSIN